MGGDRGEFEDRAASSIARGRAGDQRRSRTATGQSGRRRGIPRAFARRLGTQAIRQWPGRWPRRQNTEIRRKLLRRFPYTIFYVVDAEAVVIVAIAHQKRRRGYWKRRLPKGAR
jgi:plasmid stabilization system protein ParE